MNTATDSLRLTPAGDASATAGTSFRIWFGRTAKSVWTAMDAAGQARAHRHLMDFADRCEALQPELAKELRSASRQGSIA